MGRCTSGASGWAKYFAPAPMTVSARPWLRPSAGGPVSIFGVLADEASARLLLCANHFDSTKGGLPSGGELFAFGLKTRQLEFRRPLPATNAFCNDIAVAHDGTVYVTDTVNMQVDSFNIRAQKIAAWSADGAFGPKGGGLDGIAVLGDSLYVNTLVTGKLYRIPIDEHGRAGPSTEVVLNRPLDHPDGMRPLGDSSLLVVESGASAQLTRLDLHADTATLTPIRSGFTAGPVAVTQAGSRAYVLEGQLRGLSPSYRGTLQTLPRHRAARHSALGTDGEV